MPAPDPELIWTIAGFFVLIGNFTLWALFSGRVWRGPFPNSIFDRRNAPVVYWIIIGARLLLLAATVATLIDAFGATPKT